MKSSAEVSPTSQANDSSKSGTFAQKRKRKRNSTSSDTHDKSQASDSTTERFFTPPTSPKKKKASPRKDQNKEKRLKRFRKQAPQMYYEKLNRATSQRMFVLDRVRGGTKEEPEETVEIAGTTGNVYAVQISYLPNCTCPDNQKGNQCKHIIYVLHNVLKAPEHLQYQLAFLSSELHEIFAHAPPYASSEASSSSPEHPSNRKEIDGDCPICFTEFEPDTEEIVWCKAACGNNIHKGCFEQWAKSQKGNEVRCVFCRTPWQGDEDSIRKIRSAGEVNEEGYVNVGQELGLSGTRDYSTYHQHWVRRQFGGYY